MAKKTVKGLRVISRRESFWRAKRQFTAEPTEIALADLSPEEEELIRAEGGRGGQLVVQDINMSLETEGEGA